MELRTGTYESAMDEKGRLGIPAKVREWYGGELVFTMGMQPSVWIMKPEVWEKVSGKLNDSGTISVEESLSIQYQHILPAQIGEIDKSGRIAIPSTLRKYAKLHHDCLVMSAENHLEIWDSDLFYEYLENNRSMYQEAMRKLGPLKLFKVEE
jgi:MraZ protein